ncbi:MAG: helix-turn-helix domain-containing protein [Aquificales bacterium]|nr:helix-turn-helix domain-containing protein [Aquificales bacterium]
MARNLWELRQKRQMTVKQLAGKSGVKAGNIYAYETGGTIRMADLGKLAKALYVDSSDIKMQSDPIPKKKKKPPQAKKPAPTPTPTQKPTSAQKTEPTQPAKPQQASSKQASPATEGQLTYLRTLAAKLGQSETAVVERIGKPLEELTFQEARKWLAAYTQEYSSRRPPDTRRKRAHLPEAVDTFELAYLTARQEAGDVVTFKLFDKSEFSGCIVGFSPYSIVVQQEDGSQVTIQKLALAYYTVAEAGS